MNLSIEATYEDGMLKPTFPLPLKEHEKVRVTIQRELSVARCTAGMLPWNGDFETLRRLAEDPKFGIMGSP